MDKSSRFRVLRLYSGCSVTVDVIMSGSWCIFVRSLWIITSFFNGLVWYFGCLDANVPFSYDIWKAKNVYLSISIVNIFTSNCVYDILVNLPGARLGCEFEDIPADRNCKRQLMSFRRHWWLIVHLTYEDIYSIVQYSLSIFQCNSLADFFCYEIYLFQSCWKRLD